MKRFISQLILLCATITIFAQSGDLNNIYYSYKGEEGVVALRIPGIVMRIASSFADLDREEKQLVRSMKSIQIITMENSDLNDKVNFVDEVDLNNLRGGYHMLLQVKDGTEDVVILAREKDDCIKDLVILVGGDENVMVHIKGRMQSDLLESLAEVSGIEKLKYTKGI